MTSVREFLQIARGARLVFAMLLMSSLGACAALPDDAPVVEKLDNETGATVARLGKPVELYRETASRATTDRFAFLGPFETNQMGSRQAFLWIAVPIDIAQNPATPTIEVDGAPLTLSPPGRAPDFAGLRTSPYKIPTPWSSMYYFKVDDAVIASLGKAQSLAVRVSESTQNGPVEALFTLRVGTDPRLQEFAARP